MKARLERFETRARRKRQLALRAMSEADIPKLTEADFTASLKQGAPTLEVVDEAKVPAAYWKPQPSKLDRQGLLAALKAGVAIEGVAHCDGADAVECEDTVMALTDIQTKSLKAKLKRRHVKIREAGGASVSYVEGWHAIAEANRIFGFDSWDRQTLAPRCHWTHLQNGQTVCFYSTKVRITVRAGDTVTVREGIGTGFGRAPQPELAHDISLKAAETDATKRALATFGNPFGLALYDRGQAQVTKARVKIAIDNKRSLQPQGLVLTDGDGNEVRFSDHDAFVEATLRQIERLDSTDSLYAFWSRNSAAFGKLRLDPRARGERRKATRRCPQRTRAPRRAAPAAHVQWRDRRPKVCRRADDGLLPHAKRKAGSRSGASRFRCQPALFDLRAVSGASASRTLCAAAGAGDEGL